MLDNLYFALRCLDYAFYGGILSGLIARWRRLHVEDWPGFRLWLWVFLAASGYAVAESMWRGIPGGPRLIAITLGLGGLFVGCYLGTVRRWIKRRRRPNPTSNSGGPSVA